MLNIQSNQLSQKEYELFKNLVFEQTGISLGEKKKELVKTRLGKRLRATGIPTFKDYYNYVTSSENGGNDELISLIDAISTNKTSFFRENEHFIFLREAVIPEILSNSKKSGKKKIRVWSAGCSSGEEPYTLAIVFHENIKNLSAWDFKILATDISTRMLENASAGVYRMETIQDVPLALRRAHFQSGYREMIGQCKVKKHLRDLIIFRRLNLMMPAYPFKGLFDFIFCRNVIIYFNKKTQAELMMKYHRYLKPGGYLFLGHSEGLTGISSGLKYVKPSVYQKV